MEIGPARKIQQGATAIPVGRGPRITCARPEVPHQVISFPRALSMFHLIVGLFLIGLVIVGMVASPAFRNFVFVAVLITGGGIWWLIDSSQKEAERSRSERATQEYIATTAIK